MNKANRKIAVEECLTLGMARLSRYGIVRGVYLRPGEVRWPSGARVTAEPVNAEGRATLVLGYPLGEGEEPVECRVPLSSTCPKFGGLRVWLNCPTCGRRVAKLHRPPGARLFGCRACHTLTYLSCRESHRWDAWRILGLKAGPDRAELRRRARTRE
jgi:hypothetical protein